MPTDSRRPQRAYEKEHSGGVPQSCDEHAYLAMYSYLREDLGLPEPVARARAQAEIEGNIGRSFCDDCEKQQLSFSGQTVLDLGSGLGGLAVEVARRGATVVALEPGRAWRSIAAERLARTDSGMVVEAVGEEIPLPDNSIDLILSLQVLEHVQNPEKVIREAFRVLKPRGHFCFSYENYLSFYEPHYRVRWLPLLPKKIGAAYLRALGRDPQFLLEAITYTTFPAVRQYLRRAGFSCMRVEGFRKSLRAPEKNSLKWKAVKAVARVNEDLAVGLLSTHDYLTRTYKTAVYEFVRKP